MTADDQDVIDGLTLDVLMRFAAGGEPDGIALGVGVHRTQVADIILRWAADSPICARAQLRAHRAGYPIRVLCDAMTPVPALLARARTTGRPGLIEFAQHLVDSVILLESMIVRAGVVGTSTRAARRTTPLPVPDAHLIRAWAARNNIAVKPNGRIPSAVIRQWKDAGSPCTAPTPTTHERGVR